YDEENYARTIVQALTWLLPLITMGTLQGMTRGPSRPARFKKKPFNRPSSFIYGSVVRLRIGNFSMKADTIGTRFERQAAATPDNLAVVTDELSLTYGELDALASRIAGGLAALPSNSDRPVALLMPEGPFLYAALLGAAKAGRIFFVLPVTSPEPWLSALIAH